MVVVGGEFGVVVLMELLFDLCDDAVVRASISLRARGAWLHAVKGVKLRLGIVNCIVHKSRLFQLFNLRFNS